MDDSDNKSKVKGQSDSVNFPGAKEESQNDSGETTGTGTPEADSRPGPSNSNPRVDEKPNPVLRPAPPPPPVKMFFVLYLDYA